VDDGLRDSEALLLPAREMADTTTGESAHPDEVEALPDPIGQEPFMAGGEEASGKLHRLLDR